MVSQEIAKFFGNPDARQVVDRLVAAGVTWPRIDVAQAAESLDHHPDITIEYTKVTLRVTTHDAGGLTENDFTLAARIGA